MINQETFEVIKDVLRGTNLIHVSSTIKYDAQKGHIIINETSPALFHEIGEVLASPLMCWSCKKGETVIWEKSQ